VGGIDTGKTSPPVQVPVSLTGDAGMTQIPGLPIHRPSFLTSFVANLGPALGASFGASGDQGEQNFGTAFAGGMAGIQSYQEKMFQRGQQLQQAQRQALQQASDLALQSAQINRLQQMTPLEVQQGQLGLQEKQLQTDLLQGQIKFFADPGNLTGAVQDATKNLGKLTSDEQSQIDAAIKQAQIDQKFDPIAAAVKSVSQDRIKARAAPDQEPTPFKAWRTQFIEQKGREPNAQEIQNFTTAGQALRLTGMENLRQDNYLDTNAAGGGNVASMTAGEFAQANKQEPGRYVKFSGQVANALKAQSLINDIKDGMNLMKAAVDDPNFKGLGSAGRALMTLAARNPQNATGVIMSGLAAKGLSDSEQNYLIAHATLLERAMSMRGLQGQGAGSDQQRSAIASTLPGFATADVAMAKKQLKTLSNNVDNLDRSIPKIGQSSMKSTAGQLTPPPATSGPPAGATMQVPGSDGKLHWSDGKRDLGVIQ
jgi:hypothetical protein